MIGVGVWALVDTTITNYADFLSNLEGSAELLKFATYVVIAVGAFIMVVGFFGCCGAIKENKVMLIIVRLYFCILSQFSL